MARQETSQRQLLSASLKSAVATAAIVATIGGWVAFGMNDPQNASASTATASENTTQAITSDDQPSHQNTVSPRRGRHNRQLAIQPPSDNATPLQQDSTGTNSQSQSQDQSTVQQVPSFPSSRQTFGRTSSSR
jgi:Mg-chelatase subunit ChlI